MAENYQNNYVKLALPKGKLLPATSVLIDAIGLELENYNQETRVYRLQSRRFNYLQAKIFQEKDIPIQVAVGNYDIGICGLDWVEEVLTKYPESALIKLLDLEYSKSNLYMAASSCGDICDINELTSRQAKWRIVTEYPNLSESAALNLRLRNFSIFPVWGSAVAYPPENAELVIIQGADEEEIKAQNLIPLKNLLMTSVFLIVNQETLQTKDISQIINCFTNGINMQNKPWLHINPKKDEYSNGSSITVNEDTIWLALPDGHQQKPTIEFLNRAGLRLEGYSETNLNRRPTINREGFGVKVIRPQDMPLQIANGNFDLAITGKDWLLDHKYRFPSSPAINLVDLGFGTIKMVAVVHQNLIANSIEELKNSERDGVLSPLRVASEYINIADKYLRDNHVSRYKLIPTWGASEAFLPEDADLLIENTETGKTLAKHNLRIIDTLFQSSACLIGNKNSIMLSSKNKRISSLIDIFKKATGVD